MASKKPAKKPTPRKWSGKVTGERNLDSTAKLTTGQAPFVNKRSKKWSSEVTKYSNALDLEPGVFTWSDPQKIARSLKRSAEASERRKGSAYQSAVSMLNFYINRAGRNLPAKRRGALEKAKVELIKIFKKTPKKMPSAV